MFEIFIRKYKIYICQELYLGLSGISGWFMNARIQGGQVALAGRRWPAFCGIPILSSYQKKAWQKLGPLLQNFLDPPVSSKRYVANVA